VIGVPEYALEGSTTRALAGTDTLDGRMQGTMPGILSDHVGTMIGEPDGVTECTTMGSLAGAGFTVGSGVGIDLPPLTGLVDVTEIGQLEGAGSHASANGSIVAVQSGDTVGIDTSTGSMEISTDSKRVGVISNDDSSNTALSDGTVGAATSTISTTASHGFGLATSIGNSSDWGLWRFDRSISGGITRSVLMHLPRGIFLNTPIFILPGARPSGSTGVSPDAATRVDVGHLHPRHVYATAHHT
jgi:hypothetical protein